MKEIEFEKLKSLLSEGVDVEIISEIKGPVRIRVGQVIYLIKGIPRRKIMDYFEEDN